MFDLPMNIILSVIGILLLISFCTSLLLRMKFFWAHFVGIGASVFCILLGNLENFKTFKGKVSPAGIETEISTLKDKVSDLDNNVEKLKRLTSETTVVALRGFGKFGHDKLDELNGPVGDKILESVYGKEDYLKIKKDLVTSGVLMVSDKEKRDLNDVPRSSSLSEIGKLLHEKNIKVEKKKSRNDQYKAED